MSGLTGLVCSHISLKTRRGKAVVIFHSSCLCSRTWWRAELECWQKAPYPGKEDYRGALSRNSVCEVNWFMFKYYIQIQLILTVLLLLGVHFRTSCPLGSFGWWKESPHSLAAVSVTDNFTVLLTKDKINLIGVRKGAARKNFKEGVLCPYFGGGGYCPCGMPIVADLRLKITAINPISRL